MSEEVIAAELGLDLYTVNLATVVDKYVGEAEKNLERIFSEAVGVNGVLFFDEADAIFGKRSEVNHGRQLTVPPREVHDAQHAAQATQDTPDWQARYAIRAGVEGTFRQGIAVTGMRRARHRGLPKTRLEHVYSAVALNLIHLDAYWNGNALDRTRTSHLARLNLALALALAA